jgi:hypothetical protein
VRCSAAGSWLIQRRVLSAPCVRALQGGSGLKLGAARRVPPLPATQSGLCKRAALRRHLELLQLQRDVLQLDTAAAAATAAEPTQQHSIASGLQAGIEAVDSRCGFGCQRRFLMFIRNSYPGH